LKNNPTPDTQSRTPFLLGVAGVLLITLPFVWLRLDFNYTAGTVAAVWDSAKGSKLFLDLWPVFAVVLAIGGLRMAYLKAISGIHLQVFSHDFRSGWGPWGICWCAVFIPVFFLNNSTLSTGIFVGLWMLQALGLNIAIGMTGLLVLGYAGFYALGGYTFAIAHKFYPAITWWMALPVAVLSGGLAGWVVGLPCLRLRGDYLAIVTLGFGECFHELMRNWTNVTGGDQGLSVAPSAKIQAWGPFSALQVNYLIVGGCVLLAVGFCRRLYQSWVGRAWIAVREDEVAAASSGIPVVQMKLLAFVLSAAFGSVAGVLYVAYSGFIDPAACAFENSVMVLAMVILGGLGSIPGVLLGSALLYLIPSLMRNYFPAMAEYRLLLFGVIMVVMMVLRPQGLLGSRRHQLEIKGT
jgi:branched-chain amino acid transport system permease protein